MSSLPDSAADIRVLFIDQTAALGGAELCLRDVVGPYRSTGLVMLFEEGPLRQVLELDGVDVEVVEAALGSFRRESRIRAALVLLPALIRALVQVARRSRDFDVVYANTQKAMLVGALASGITGTPLVFHLHDILSEAHFSRTSRWLSTRFANRFCRVVIADSEATRDAFVASGGHEELVSVVYYGFELPSKGRERREVLTELGVDPEAFVVGHFSRLSPWKGQEVLLKALQQCPLGTHVVLCGEALFGEEEFVVELRDLVDLSGLGEQVTFAGFRPDVSDLMAACDLVVHSSTAPEPFGRVIVEAMLSGTPVVAARAGGPCEILRHGETGWLTRPGDVAELGACITSRRRDPADAAAVAASALDDAMARFGLPQMHAAIAELLRTAIADR